MLHDEPVAVVGPAAEPAAAGAPVIGSVLRRRASATCLTPSAAAPKKRVLCLKKLTGEGATEGAPERASPSGSSTATYAMRSVE